MPANPKDQILGSLIKIFPADGYAVEDLRDYVDTEILGSDKATYASNSINPEDMAYLKQWKVVLTSFLGLPNKNLNQTSFARNLFLNFIGWNANHSLARNIIGGVPYTLFNIVLTLSRLFTNIVKLGTEALPQILSDLIATARQTKPSNPLLNAVLGAAHVFTALWVILGRALTSPATNARLAISYGTKFGEALGHPNLFGFLGATMAIGLTAIVYALLWPLAVKVLASKVVPVAKELAPHLPQLLKTAIGFLKTALTYIKPVTRYIDQHMVGGLVGLIKTVASAITMPNTKSPRPPVSSTATIIATTEASSAVPPAIPALPRIQPHAKNRGCNIFTTLSRKIGSLFQDNSMEAKIENIMDRDKYRGKIL